MQHPKSVEQIVKEAQNFDHKTQYPLRIALRTAQNIINQAANCERNGNLQDAYLFLYRHAEFCMSQIATHPERKQPEHKAAVVKVTKEVQTDLQRLEGLKPEIAKRYQMYTESLQRIQAEREKHRSESRSRTPRLDLDGASEDAYGSAQLLNAGEHSELALKLAHRELRRRGIHQGPARDRTAAEQRDFDELAHNLRNLGRQLDPRDVTTSERTSAFSYPGVKSSQLSAGLPGPAPPPKDYTTTAPPLPAKSSLQPSSAEPLASSSYTFTTRAKTESGAPLRPLFLPTELRPQFLSLARSNTLSNLETCGILCGSLISNALFISHLVIPDQVSTSDTCDTTDAGDAELFDYVDGQELMVCGWIHTHPTQTCFLSSRDLHTSVGYQVMLPESVAIVCAPTRDPDHGIFRLTDPPGKQAILACDKQGLFHPHDTQNLYTDAMRPGHVEELKGLQFQVVDLRKGKK